MNRCSPRPMRHPLFGGVAALGAIAAASCSANNSVQPGAPVLIEMIILQGGGAATTILPTTPECPPLGGADGGAAPTCLPMGQMADADAGTDAIPPDTLCYAAATTDWCTCAASDPATPNEGTWGCSPFASTIGVLAIFDRVIDTAPFDAADGGATTGVATLSVPASAPTPPDLLSDYASNGSRTGLIFQLFKGAGGNFRVDGPSIAMVPATEFPSATTVTVSLSKTAVRSKGGQPFKAEGIFQDGTLSFNTAPFTASIATPMPTGDASTEVAPDMTPVTVTFTNLVAVADVMSHITVTAGAGGAPVDVDIASADNLNVTLTPKTTWPASSTITIKVDQNAADLLGEKLSAPVPPASFTTSAS